MNSIKLLLFGVGMLVGLVLTGFHKLVYAVVHAFVEEDPTGRMFLRHHTVN